MKEKKYTTKRVQSNLIQQNCYVRDVLLTPDVKTDYPEKSYVSVDEVVTNTGIEVKPTTNSYPITPQYVNSFVDSSDYHKDPANAIANGVKRQNLGDITAIQQLRNMNSSEQLALYEQLRAKFSNPVDSKPADSESNSEV